MKYLALDGKVFDTSAECEAYEKHLNDKYDERKRDEKKLEERKAEYFVAKNLYEAELDLFNKKYHVVEHTFEELIKEIFPI